MKNTTTLKKLSRVVDLILDRELSALSEISIKGEAIEAEIRNLDTALLALNRQTSERDQTELSVHNFAWQDWRRKTKIALNVKLATIKADKEIQLAITRKAFGRAQVIETVASKPRGQH